MMAFAVIAVIPDRDLKYFSVVGQRTLGIYFWHKPTQYLLKMGNVLPRLVVLFGGTYSEAAAGPGHGLAFGGSSYSMIAGFIVYLVICTFITWFFSFRIFEHPCSDFMKLAAKLTGRDR